MDVGKNTKYQMLNAVIPHLDFKYRKKLSVAVKLMEIRGICRYYDTLEEPGETNSDWKRNVINAVLPYLSGQKQNNLKTMAHMLEMKEIMDNINLSQNPLKDWDEKSGMTGQAADAGQPPEGLDVFSLLSMFLARG